jgi:hypothetical protein
MQVERKDGPLMSENKLQGKSRRRFLADMLFLGGGLTAAGLLAKARLLDAPEAEPPVAGAMAAAPPPSPDSTVSPAPECSLTPEPSCSHGPQPSCSTVSEDPVQPPPPGGVVAPSHASTPVAPPPMVEGRVQMAPPPPNSQHR